MAEASRDQDSCLLGLKEVPVPQRGDGDHEVDLTVSKEKLNMVDLSQDMEFGSHDLPQDQSRSRTADGYFRRKNESDSRPFENVANRRHSADLRTFKVRQHRSKGG